MTARKNTKKNLQPRFVRRPLPSLSPEKERPVHPGMALVHENAVATVKLIRAGRLDAAFLVLGKVHDEGLLRLYGVAFAAIAAGKPLPAFDINDITPRTPEDGADDAVELR